MIAAVVAVVTEDWRGHHDDGRRWPIGVTGARKGNGDASGGSDSNHTCKDRQRITDAGFDAYQSKPIKVKDFVAAVERLLDHPRN